MPVARVGDAAVCNGPSDAIASGSASVVICGQPVARVGDRTIHGGVIVSGCASVLIGDTGSGMGLAAAAGAAAGLEPSELDPVETVEAVEIPEPGAVPGKVGPRLPKQDLTAPGWPDLPGREAVNFTSARAVELPPGTKLYRVIDEDSNPAGGYWSSELPGSMAEWRSQFAVPEDWNRDGRYVEHSVGPRGLRVWKGPSASQAIPGKAGYVQPGGAEQIWMPAGTLQPGEPRSSGWGSNE